MWVARHKNGEITLFKDKPVRKREFFCPKKWDNLKDLVGLPFNSKSYDWLFSEITWENSPKKLKIET